MPTIIGNASGSGGYDAVGNRLTMTSTLGGVPSGSFSYDANDRLSVDTYNNNGNTTASGGITNNYDFEDRMTQHGSVTLVYDGDGNRVSETAGGVTTKYLVDDLNPTGVPQVLDEIVGGSVNRTYAYGLQRISENQLVGSIWTPSLYGYDGHGNVRFLANTSGTVTDTYQYDAFGMPIASTGTTSNNYRYSGERFDSSIGLYDLRARYYNQATGRFWSMDPYPGKLSRPSTLHKYAYTGNNPVNYIDPTGRVFDTTALWFKITAGTTLGAWVLGETLEWAFACEGHKAASAVPGTSLPPFSLPLPSQLSGGAVISRPEPPPPQDIGPPAEPCTLPTHLGLPPQGPPSLGPPYWPDPRPGGGPLGPPTGPGEVD